MLLQNLLGRKVVVNSWLIQLSDFDTRDSSSHLIYQKSTVVSFNRDYCLPPSFPTCPLNGAPDQHLLILVNSRAMTNNDKLRGSQKEPRPNKTLLSFGGFVVLCFFSLPVTLEWMTRNTKLSMTASLL